MIELKSITKKYSKLTAVNEISFRVEEGEICVLIGPSGCGKTTIIKMINSMLEPTSGQIYIQGKNIEESKPEILRRSIGYVIQNIGLFPHMTVAQNIGVVPRLLGWSKNSITARTEELLDLLGLDPDEYSDKYPGKLSGGEAQRIGVARALAADPPLLLMDEPFGAVDPLNRETLQIEFLKIQRKLKKTVIFVTHDLDEAIRLADTIVLLKEGSIIQKDTPENMLAHPKNRFVKNFMGTDRALKRLARFTVADYLSKAEGLCIEENISQCIKNKRDKLRNRFLWITDRQGRLIGWLDIEAFLVQNDIEDALTRVNPAEIALGADFTLKEALARMLSQGVSAIPVIDNADHLIGEINLSTIEKITQEGYPK